MRKYKKTLFFGYVIHDVSKLTGIAYAVVWRNANNKNSISPKNAKIYYPKNNKNEKLLKEVMEKLSEY